MANRPPRLHPGSYRGLVRVFYTTCVHKRARIFVGDTFSRLCVSRLLRLAKTYDVAVLAYCLMPDHAHALLAGCSEGASSLECFIAWKHATASMARVRLGVRLWQPSLFDRVLRDDDASVAAAAYVLANPIRAGLSRALGEYPLAGSTEFGTDALAAAMQDRWSPRGTGRTG